MSKDFYDRTDELTFLSEQYTRGSAEMIVIYGRRRVGKTELIKEFMASITERKLYFYVDLSGKSELLNSLSDAVREQLKESERFGDFESFFSYLSRKSDEGKFLLVIDEFQRFLDVAPEFITKLQHRWDSELKKKKLMILLVGSSIGMINKITESRAGSLYGRVSRFKISPFRYVDFRLMFNDAEEDEKIIRYAVFGGTPYYLSKTKGIKDTLQAISDLLLKKGGELVEEPRNLLEYENVRVYAKYNSILHSIASGKERLKEMQDFTSLTSTVMPAYITRLDHLLDLVGKQDPMLGKERLGKYVIRDNFFKFWYRFIFPNQTALNLGNTKIVFDAIKDNLNSYVGKIFEDIARELLTLYINKEIKSVKMDFENIGAWWDRNGNEIDIVAYNHKAKRILVGEVKWTNNPADTPLLEELMMKSRLINFNGTYQYMLISKNGFTERCIKRMEELKVLYLNLQDMETLFDNAG